jgi:hypothetical protein
VLTFLKLGRMKEKERETKFAIEYTSCRAGLAEPLT